MIRLLAMEIAGVTLIAAALTGPTPAQPQPVKTAPLAYFDAHCSRCHGTMGSFYGDSFGKDLSDAKLQEAVRSMAAGPGGAPLTGVDLTAEIAFHRSLAAGTPFLVWTAFKAGTIEGEVTPDSKLTLVAGGRPLKATLKEWSWKATLPTGAKPKDVVITATLAGKTTRLDLSKASFTHTKS